MIAAVRIHGQVGLSKEVEETLKRLRIRKKYNLVFIDENDKVKVGMIKRVKDYIMYGKISDDLVEKIIEARGELKEEGKKVKKSLENVKPWIRLHPPRGGFKKSTKLPYPKGILGENKDIAKYLEKML
ncbi:MAG: uL30 family ribosomal protein [Candidatus Pacearchaeota archaeon]